MTFSNEIRNEIAKTLHDKERKFACLYGIFLYSKMFSESNLTIQSENYILMDVIKNLTESVFRKDLNYSIIKKGEDSAKCLYSFNINEETEIKKITTLYGIDLNERKINNSKIINGSLAEFLAGVFLCCGSMIDPNKEYHLEFGIPTERLCRDLENILLNLGIKCGISKRKKLCILYIENSESIEDLLTFMGAQKCTIDLINIKIYKNFVNKTNRITNCDVANLNKTVSASIKQIKSIKKIEEHMNLDELPPDLYEIASLRLANKEASLEEIGSMLSKPIGKSAVSRRFQKLDNLASKFEVEKNDK